MGRRSDSEDDYDLKKSKKKKKRRSRSRSRSTDSDSSRYSSKHKKSKKSKHKKRSESRSRERFARRSRSRSRGRRSSSRGRRSRSRERYRSRSRERRRSRSRSRDRHRSRSRDRYARRRSRSDSRGRGRRSRSDSRGRGRRSRSDSRGRGRRSSRTPEKKKNRSRTSPVRDIQADIREQIPNFDDLTPSDQANARMKLALKAAAAADEKIREQLGEAPTSDEVTNFANAVMDIEAASFKPSSFKSSRGEKIKTEPTNDGYTTHEQAIFGAGRIDIKLEPVKPIYIEPDSYAHPNLFCDPEERMDRWIQKLSGMRKRKLEGEAI